MYLMLIVVTAIGALSTGFGDPPTGVGVDTTSSTSHSGIGRHKVDPHLTIAMAHRTPVGKRRGNRDAPEAGALHHRDNLAPGEALLQPCPEAVQRIRPHDIETAVLVEGEGDIRGVDSNLGQQTRGSGQGKIHSASDAVRDEYFDWRGQL